jgi:hypothetical protein
MMAAVRLRDVPECFFDANVWNEIVTLARTKQNAVELLDAANPQDSTVWWDCALSGRLVQLDMRERKNGSIRLHAIHRTDTPPGPRRVKVPYAEYPAPMVFYKMGRAGLLEGLRGTVDVSNAWQFVAITDEVKTKAFQKKFGVPLTARFRNMPGSFARLLAKVGYCNLLTMLDPGDFRPICLPYIMGHRANPSYIVGGTFEVAEPETVGYRLSTFGFGTSERVMLVAEIRLFANVATPTYHVVVGDVFGGEKVAAIARMEGITVEPATWPAASTEKRDHWMPSVSPLPFWASDDAPGGSQNR